MKTKEYKKALQQIYSAISILALFSAGLFSGCATTVDVEEEHANQFIEMNNEPEEDELLEDEVFINEIMKTNDVASAIIYVEPPEVRYDAEAAKKESKKLTGTEALKKNLSDITVLPEYEDEHLKAWRYKEGDIYQLHTQTYHSTIIQLEPGEEMLEVPYISEPDVWRLSRGIGIKDGKDTQFLIIKPDYSSLTSTLIIITNRRVYQLELKSYKDHYMPYAIWVYPQQIQDSASWIEWQKRKQKAAYEFGGTNMQYCSVDYLIKYPAKKRPSWCPTMVYDDGKFTYIILDETTLHTSMPTAFIGKKQLVNTEIHKNIIVINQLIEKVTLVLGKQKVTVIKKINKQTDNTVNTATTQNVTVNNSENIQKQEVK